MSVAPQSEAPRGISRRAALQSAAAVGAVAALQSTVAGEANAAESAYLVGRGIADTTGPCAENGMMGYSMPQQVATGISDRLRTRAFVIVDPASGNRVAWCVGDHAILPVAAHAEIVKRLKARFPGLYDMHNVCVNATHTHHSAGGCSHDFIYNLAIFGFQQQAFDAMVDGYVEAIAKAHADLKPGTIHIGRTELTDASVNRSKVAFDLNPAADKAHFPNAIDPSVLVLRFRQGGADVGALTWYSTHGTSLPNTNTLLTGDNKGYAAYAWERTKLGQDYLSGGPGFVAAFANTASGDMSPNLALKPGTGPTDDPHQNVRIIGQRQMDAGLRAWSSATEQVSGPIGGRAQYVDMSKVDVEGRFTPDGQPHRTAPAVLGASMLAGSVEDGPGLPIPEGTTDPLAPMWAKLPTDTPLWLQQAQAPKACAVPAGLIDAAPDVLAFQVLRIGQLVLACGPAEYTIVSGLRIRQQLAKQLGVPLENVICQGYANGYSEYVTTPEEYMSQQYEGGSTLYGRWTLCAHVQNFSRLADALAAGSVVEAGTLPPDSPLGWINLVAGVVYDNPPIGKRFGDVLTQPAASVARGASAKAVFVTGHPKNDLRRGGTYLEVQRLVGGTWTRVLDDGDWETTFEWKRTEPVTGQSTATLTWNVPASATPGTYRFVHRGASKAPVTGVISQFTGTSNQFTVA